MTSFIWQHSTGKQGEQSPQWCFVPSFMAYSSFTKPVFIINYLCISSFLYVYLLLIKCTFVVHI